MVETFLANLQKSGHLIILALIWLYLHIQTINNIFQIISLLGLITRHNEALYSLRGVVCVLTIVSRLAAIFKLVIRITCATVLYLGARRVVFENFLGVTSDLCGDSGPNILSHFLPILPKQFDC